MRLTHSKQMSELDATKRQLHEATKANERLSILCNNLRSQLQSTKCELTSQCSEVNALRTERASCQQEAHVAKLQLDKQRLLSHKLQRTIDSQLRLESIQQHQQYDERVKSQCTDIRRLEQRVKELEEELVAEQQAHARSHIALDHLRTHFASLPLTDSAQPPNAMVRQDQLTSWQQ